MVQQPTGLAMIVRKYRQRAMLTQEALAEQSLVSVRTIRNIESGQVVPQVASLRRLTQALGIPPRETALLAAQRSVAKRRARSPATDISPAMALFLRLAAEAAPKRGVPVTARAEIARICRRLDGVPLALELAAARLRTLSVVELADRLDRDLPAPAGTVADAQARHQLLIAVIDWSHRMLDSAAQRLLARVSIFPGEFDLQTVERVLGYGSLSERAVLPALASLVNHALVRARDDGTTTYYRLPEEVREYAQRELSRLGEREAVRSRLDREHARRPPQR